MITIKIASDYSRTPGGRFIREGEFSGEDFRNVLLKPKFLEAETTKDMLTVDLDGGYGYATSFLEEAFGGLARELHNVHLLNIKIISNEEPALVEKIHQYISDALN